MNQMYIILCRPVCVSVLPADHEHAQDQNDWESDTGQHTRLQIVSGILRNIADDGRTERTAQISGQREQRKHCSAARRQDAGGNADGTRPHDSHREAAQSTADQAQNRQAGQTRQQVAAQAQNPGSNHEDGQIDLLTVFAVQKPADPHQYGKAAGACQIAGRLGNMQCGFRERRSPLRHGDFRGTCAYHQHDEDPEGPGFTQLNHGHALTLGDQLFDRAGGKIENVIQRDHCPKNGQDAPAVYAKHGKEQRGTQDHAH